MDVAQDRFNSRRFLILILVVTITGLSQGLLLPLLTILLEQDGASSGANGLNAAAMYMGIFATMLFVEKPVQRFGYKPVIAAGIVVITAATLLFPLWDNIVFWFILRVAVGIGDSALHYASQLWVTSTSPADKRGRNISLYGLSYGIGFSIGPLGINLLLLGRWLPFVAVCAVYLLGFALLLRLKNGYPGGEGTGNAVEQQNPKRYVEAVRLGWFALMTSFLYGYMESSINGNFPVYGLRLGLTPGWISVLLPAVALGSLVLQIPLGLISDRVGRKRVLMTAALIGGLAFLLVPSAGDNAGWILTLFAIAGGLVGSFYSLGLAYVADLLPLSLLPAANVLASINFSLGSIAGPNMGGFGIQYLSPGSMFYFLGGLFVIFALVGFFDKGGVTRGSV